MGKSLTEAARAILMKESSTVGGYPSVDPMGAGHPDREATAKKPADNLQPGAVSPEAPFANPGSTPPNSKDYEDLGPALIQQGDIPPSAKAAGKVGKDKSASSKSAVPAEPPKSVAEEMEDEGDVVKEALVKKSKLLADKMKKLKKDKEEEKDSIKEDLEDIDEDYEISEELEDFINEMIEDGYTEEEIAEAVNENFEIVEKHDEDDKDDKDDKKVEEGLSIVPAAGGQQAQGSPGSQSGISVPKEVREESDKKKVEERSACMKEHVDALLAGENLSEEFRSKAQTIFESAVSQRVNEELETLEQAYVEALEEEVQKIHETLSQQVDDYLNYVVEQWISENEVAIESGLRSELTEDFISGLRNLFAEHYIDIPDVKVDMVETLGEKIEELEAKLNEEIDKNVKLTKTINESKQFEVLVNACDGLTTTQAEKLKTLAENIEFTSESEYTQKITTLKESYFPATVNSDKVLDTAESTTDGKSMISEELKGPMASYVRTLGKTMPR